VEVVELLVGWRSRDTSGNIGSTDMTTCKALFTVGSQLYEQWLYDFEEHHGVEGHGLSLTNRVATRNQLI
jgi:hypothetical protein